MLRHVWPLLHHCRCCIPVWRHPAIHPPASLAHLWQGSEGGQDFTPHPLPGRAGKRRSGGRRRRRPLAAGHCLPASAPSAARELVPHRSLLPSQATHHVHRHAATGELAGAALNGRQRAGELAGHIGEARGEEGREELVQDAASTGEGEGHREGRWCGSWGGCTGGCGPGSAYRDAECSEGVAECRVERAAR